MPQPGHTAPCLPPPAAPPAAGTDATGEQECADLGCCWSFPAPLKLEPWQPDVYLPACYYANGGSSSYAAVNASSDAVAEAGFDGAPDRFVCCAHIHASMFAVLAPANRARSPQLQD